MFVLVFKVLCVLRSLEWSLSSKDRPVCSVDGHVFNSVLLDLAVPRRLWFRSLVGAPDRTVSGPTCYTCTFGGSSAQACPSEAPETSIALTVSPWLRWFLAFFPLLTPFSYTPFKCQIEKVAKTIGGREGSRSARFRAVSQHGVFMIALHVNPHSLMN